MLLGDAPRATSASTSERERGILLALASMTTAAAVAISGLIGFVGLVVPHVVRLLVGPAGAARHPALGDRRARRCWPRPTSSPGCSATSRSGVVMAILGAPFFLVLLYRSRDGIRAVIAEPILWLSGVTVAFGDRAVVDGRRPVARRPASGSPWSDRTAPASRPCCGSMAGSLEPAAGRSGCRAPRSSRVDRKAVARTIAVVPELAQLPFAMTGRRGRRARPAAARTTAQRRPRVATRSPSSAIERVGVGHLRGRDARALSLGERQLVFVAVAVAQAAPILILDEPTAHLDIRHQVEVMELLVDLNERDGTTVVAVLHDLALAAHFFPRVVVMDGGRIVADGPPSTALGPESIRGCSASTRRSSTCRSPSGEGRRREPGGEIAAAFAMLTPDPGSELVPRTRRARRRTASSGRSSGRSGAS